jgi:hypothetical protein
MNRTLSKRLDRITDDVCQDNQKVNLKDLSEKDRLIWMEVARRIGAWVRDDSDKDRTREQIKIVLAQVRKEFEDAKGTENLVNITA